MLALRLQHEFKQRVQHRVRQVIPGPYWAATVLCSVSSSAWNLSFWASQAALSLLDQEQLFIQRVLLKLQLLQTPCCRLQFLL